MSARPSSVIFGRPIVETPTGGTQGPARARSVYFPLALIAPAAAPIQTLLGVDVASAPPLRPSLVAARDGGRPVMTQALNLDSDGLPTAVGLLIAVYDGGPAPATRAERRASLRGFVGGVFGIAHLADSARALLPRGARLQILSAGARVLDTGKGPLAGATSEAAIGATGWTVRVALVEDPMDALMPLAALGAGAVTLLLLLGGLFAQANQRRGDREEARALLQHEADTGVARLADRVAQRLGIGDTGRGPIRHAALLHDVGKGAIPDSILQKPSALDAAERAFIERHTIIAERILRAPPSLTSIAPLVRSSHERWDGAGYPDGLAGEEIPLGARIVFACDAFDAMTSSLRTYRKALSESAALDEIAACAGTQFDPDVAAALIATVREGDPAAAGALDPAPAILATPR